MPEPFPTSLARALCVLLVSLTCGCSLIPNAGPLKSEVGRQDGREASGEPFVLVDITEDALRILNGRDGASLVESLVSPSTPPKLTVGTGDQLELSIWEAGAQPLFSASGSSVAQNSGARAAQLPAQTVDSAGQISVPYAGRVEVAGLTLEQVEQKVQQALGGKAAKPQVIATLSKSRNGSATVLGKVGRPGHIVLSPARERILDVLADAGGVPLAAHEAKVTLTRGQSSVAVPFSAILAQPGENVFVFPGDIISVSHASKSFTAFGATGKNARIPFDREKLSLIEAVALAGGLLDPRANPRGVYLMRREPTAVARPLAGDQISGKEGGQAIVYRLDLSQVNSFFLGQDFQVEDGDMLYVANAATTSIRKILELFGLVTQPIIQGVVFEKALED